MDMKDYKKRLIELLDEMHEDGNDGVIPMVVAEGLRECKAYDRNAPNGNIAYWTVVNLAR